MSIKISWLSGGLAVLVVFLLWVGFRGCNALPTHLADKTTVDSAVAVYAKDKKADQAKIDSLTRDDQVKTDKVDSLRGEVLAAQQNLWITSAGISETIAGGVRDRAVKDTGAIVSNCDVLVDEVDAQEMALDAYAQKVDSLMDAAASQVRTKDSLAAEAIRLYHTADTTLGIIGPKYDDLFADYTKANRRLAFNKGLSRVEAIAILAAVAKIFIFK